MTPCDNPYSRERYETDVVLAAGFLVVSAFKVPPPRNDQFEGAKQPVETRERALKPSQLEGLLAVSNINGIRLP
jgi:hypothetical protein